MRPGQAVSGLLVLLLACNHVPPKQPKREGETIRYRLLLRGNPVSSADAAHCFAQCQSAETPNKYVDCLSACPGFETTPGEYCSNTDVPPEAACLTVRVISAKKEPPAGVVVLAIIGEVALVVGAASLCSISSTQCGMQMPPPR
ncbi:MAG: hypothetical protein ABUL60_29155 [Myxococcales bacterium]